MKYTYTFGKCYDGMYFVLAKATSKQDALIIADVYRRAYGQSSTDFIYGCEIRRYKGKNIHIREYEVIKAW